MLGFVTIGTFAFLSIWIALYCPKRLLYLYTMSLPLFGVVAEVGVQVTPFLIVGLGMWLAMLIRPTKGVRTPLVFHVYLIYIICSTVLLSFILPDEVNQYPMLRGQLRWASQLVNMVILFAPVFFVSQLRPSLIDLNRALTVFVYTVVVMCFIAFVQLYIFNTTGVDLFPINLFYPESNDMELRSALSDIGEEVKLFRVTSLGGGEPKHFGYTCVIALSITLIRWITRKEAVGKSKLLDITVVFVLIAGTLLTLSTQSYLLLGLNVVAIILFTGFMRGALSREFIFSLIATAIVVLIGMQSDFVSRLVQARVYERILDTGAIEDFNTTILKFLNDNPAFYLLGTGLGNVHFWAAPYIPFEFMYYMRDSVFVAKSGLLRVVSEQGIIGMILFFSTMGYVSWKLYRRYIMFKDKVYFFYFAFISIVLIDFLVSSDSSPYYILALAWCLAVGLTDNNQKPLKILA